MENTTENKAKFFSLYWGKTFINGINGHSILSFIDINDLCLGRITGKLLLTPLSQISYEDAEHLGVNSANGYDEYGANYRIGCSDWKTYDVDYLRSKGYALPWMGVSVEEQVNRGWVKLREA